MELEVVRLKIAKGGIIVGHDYRTGRFVPESCSFLKYAVIEAVHEFMIQNNFRMKFLSFEPDQFYSFALQEM